MPQRSVSNEAYLHDFVVASLVATNSGTQLCLEFPFLRDNDVGFSLSLVRITELEDDLN